MNYTKAIALVSLALAAMAVLVAATEPVDADPAVTVDGLIFDLDASTGEATLTGVTSGLTAVDASPFIYDGTTYAVTSVGSKALYSNKSVTSAYLPDVESIGMKAFASCSSLTSLDFGDSARPLSIGSYAFYKTSVDSILLPSGTKTISSYAFIYTSPSSISIPSSVKTVGSKAFYGMDLVDSDGITALSATVANMSGYDFVLVGGSLVRLMSEGDTISSDGMTFKVTDSSLDGVYADLIGYSGSSTSISVPESISCGGVPVKIVGVASKAFYNDDAISRISMPYVESIGYKAFASSDVSEVVLGSSLSSIGSYAFFGCPLVSLEIPGDGVDVGASAFSGCKSLTSISIPGTGSTFGSKAFYGITFYDVDGTTKMSISSSGFQGSEYCGTAVKMVKKSPVDVGTEFDMGSLKYRVIDIESPSVAVIGMADGASDSSVTIPSSVVYLGLSLDVTAIDSKAFYRCRTLFSIDVGDVESIGSKAFASSSLTRVVLGDGLRTISAYAFYKCPLIGVEIPESVSVIGSYAFYECTSVTSLALLGTGYSFGKSVFSGLTFYEMDGATEITIDDADFQGHSYAGSDAVLVMVPSVHVGDVFSVSGLDYSVTSVERGAYAVEVAGFSHGSALTQVQVPSSVTYDGCTFSVTAIGSKAFYRNAQIESLKLPDSVVDIGSKAFVSCSSLENIDLGDGELHIGVDAFTASKNVKSISFPSKLSLGTRAMGSLAFYGPDGSSILASASNLQGRTFEGSGSSSLNLVITVSFLFCDNFENDGLTAGLKYPMEEITVHPGIWVHGTGISFQSALADACSTFGIQVTFDSNGGIASIDDVVDGNIYIQKWDSDSYKWIYSKNGEFLTLMDLCESDTDIAIVHGGASDLGVAPTPRMTPDDRRWYFGDDIEHYTDGVEVLFYLGDNFIYSGIIASSDSNVDPCTLLVDGLWIRGYAEEGALSAYAFVDALEALDYSNEIDNSSAGDFGWIYAIGEASDSAWLQAVWYPDKESWQQGSNDDWLAKTLVSEGLIMCVVHGGWEGDMGATGAPYPETTPNDMIWAY
ncbi:MAG: leucine-rich repeat protein [Candidatus Methanomethylophilaceae archaeon]|nr:leucine-rich repeat protein [Candidatus Methanomethylophilaceae archaeon]